ncbi:MAG TPA: aminopeptidase N [Hellea balneolensis]|uniref:Aminopeptidase N n=1 Tax=Hellea balneolensis TaxID=287478 RepID=A0A7C5QVT3_9PROT|nr:aminopeptidase N [Hellea balneolensis]
MKTDTPVITRLKDYKAPDFKIHSVHLDFNLGSPTRVHTRLDIEKTNKAAQTLKLDGENITLRALSIDGQSLSPAAYTMDKKSLTLHGVPDRFVLEMETLCDPANNKALMGLYMSGGRFCTQCEAEGFRRITYYMDRPDVMSVFTVRVEADKSAFPTLLSNGNCIESGDLEKNRHYTIWHDPFPKPCYLFALVAGKFDQISDTFTTMSGRDIPLDIYVDPGDASRAHYAMDALKRSMKWDEETFGREYDLDRFMIVAVRDFNFGAMENKGLNIFNSSLLLADEASATDLNFELIESVVAHEYFHNWTGNRITCRDWFQLCLKEGFTVFRDQEFSASQRGAALQRIKDVKALRARQFPEDAGPLAHPVRPQSYMKIDNFYTATIYEKGAELIRMLKTILGADNFRKGCDYYFETLDGQATTIEAFIQCFEQACHRDLSAFLHWYHQAGTPRINIEQDYQPETQTLKLRLSQHTPPTPGQAQKHPLPIPVKFSLIAPNGEASPEQLFVLSKEKDEITIPNIREKPILSALQAFSAPVILSGCEDTDDLVLRMHADPDLFNRWEAGQTLGREILSQTAQALQTGRAPTHQQTTEKYLRAIGEIINDLSVDFGFKALALQSPTDGDIMQTLAGQNPDGTDPLAIRGAIKWLKRMVGETYTDKLISIYSDLSGPNTFSPDAQGAGRRALRNTCLDLLANTASQNWLNRAWEQFEKATNMTEEYAALLILTRQGTKSAELAQQQFFDKWKSNPLVVDKWFAALATTPGESGFEVIKNAPNHPVYQNTNPNRVRSLLGGFIAGNLENFHRIDGQGYAFVSDHIIAMDKHNPMVAARLLGAFEIWNKLDPVRQTLIKTEINRIIAAKPSTNVLEIATKSLGK